MVPGRADLSIFAAATARVAGGIFVRVTRATLRSVLATEHLTTTLLLLLPQFVSTIILIIYVLISARHLPATYLLLPVLLLLQVIAMIGVAYLLSAVGTYFRDIKDFVQLFGTAGMYAMPVFYLPGWLPEIFKPVIYANPFSRRRR